LVLSPQYRDLPVVTSTWSVYLSPSTGAPSLRGLSFAGTNTRKEGRELPVPWQRCPGRARLAQLELKSSRQWQEHTKPEVCMPFDKAAWAAALLKM